MLSQREKAEAELDRIKRHLARIGRKAYRHLHPYVSKLDRVVIYYTRTRPQTELRTHPIQDPAGFHEEYWRVRNGGPSNGGTPATMRREEGSHAQGTWNAAFDVVEKTGLDGKKGNTQRAYFASLATARLALGSLTMAKTKPFEIKEFLAKCAADKKNTVNILTVLKKAYLVGYEREWTRCDLSPALMLPAKKKKRDDEASFYRPYEQWEIDLWRATYPIAAGSAGAARGCFELAYLSLPRSDVVRIAPCHIGINEQGERVLVGLARRKTGVAYNAVIASPDLIAWLDAQPAPAEGEVVDRLGRSTTPFLRKQRSGEPYVPGNLIGDDVACQKGADQLGCDWHRWRKKVPGLPADFRLHAGRHTSAHDSALAGVDGRDAAWSMGQKDQRTINIYKQDRDAQVGGQRASRRIAAFREERRLREQQTNADLLTAL